MRFLVAAGFCLIFGGALAQPATDHELYASYCVGVLLQQGDWSKANPYKVPAEFQEVEERHKREDQQRLSRFQSYLVARGFISGENNLQRRGNLLAIQRGRSDYVNCNSDFTPCSNACSATKDTDAEKVVACITACSTRSLACRSTNKCREPDSLPF